MNREKISSQEIIDQVSVKARVSKRAAEEFLKAMISTIEDAIIAGEQVKVKGFGTFKLQWNEARKSVNVKTGEEIILDGYYKVAFSPETSLKDIVNQPFAHLEPVLLDAANNFVIPDHPQPSEHDPLKAFSEQASEIRDILSEIKALSKGADAVVVVEDATDKVEDVSEWPLISDEDDDEDDDISDELEDDLSEMLEADDENVEDESVQNELPTVVDEQAEELVHTELLPVEDVIVEEQEPVEVLPLMDNYADSVSEIPVVQVESVPEEAALPASDGDEVVLTDSKAQVVSEQTLAEEPIALLHVPDEHGNENNAEDAPELDLHATPFMVAARRKRAKRTWIISVLSVIICLGAGGFLLYYFNGNVSAYVDHLLHSSFGLSVNTAVVPPPVQKPVKAVSPKVKVVNDSTKMERQPADTLTYLKQERSYDEFIASEQITKGERLEMLALKYYGDTVFWVYIFEANKERIDNPDMLMDGTLIRVPKLDHRMIDLKNPRCANYAKELASKYIRK